MTTTLNERAWRLVESLVHRADSIGAAVHDVGGTRVLDLGVEARGGIEAGIGLARVCLAGLGEVSLAPACSGLPGCPLVQVHTDAPVLACMASQYAGWQVSEGEFFGMGSGPMRAKYGKEELFDDIPGKEDSPVAVGVLESEQLPGADVVDYLTGKLGLEADKLSLLVAPATSLAGSIQVVARSVETAMHKLHELKLDLGRVVSGYGTAPLPPVARKTMKAIGRTNDSILYSGEVTLWVNVDEEILVDVGPKVPAMSSSDYGDSFAETLARYDGDFYKIDPLLFSPAVVTFHNLRSGKSHRFGKVDYEVASRSFFE